MSWKTMPDGVEKRAEYLRAVQERAESRRPPASPEQEPGSRSFNPWWALVLAIAVAIVAVGLLR